MADLATPDFLSSLKALSPPHTPNAPSHLSTSRPSSATPSRTSSRPSTQQAPLGTRRASAEEQLVLARKVHEAVLQSGLLSGMPRAINTLVALHHVMPEHLRAAKPLRDTRRPPAEWDKHGEALFSAVYRDTAPSVQSLLDAAYPDLGWFCTTVGYGMTYGGTDVLSVVELVYVMAAALIAVDAPRQVGWHLANARRSGASLEEVRAVRATATEVAQRAGVRWRNDVLEVEA
ncbi:hypothetical protein DICSQDRAFT_161003 [Dichomitus squalens LYAD-421 SS1]|uniref:uncharacterized protein n=1 Tax=Dichomitus squalens (strain LYAD-421) TaxID=732165 RepID=UPI0004411E70|nr:uncharacterized protein DICSQDRAFT_161003 [Dichomitus squalens LYAD-421 SS1]EJF62701.1 hypothetical protein DICSQDRAFT_161003 [Dichomitus squalens LYAD-421 SS1]